MVGEPENIRPHVEKLKWRFSAIDGDILLGDGLKCYATRMFNSKLPTKEVLDALHSVTQELTDSGCNVVRRKVEMVIYDDRSIKVNCTGGCIECHLDDMK
jgi:hypothetical protein